MSEYVSPEKEIMITLRLSKVWNSQSMIGGITTYTVCETCMIDTAHESIIFPFIFIVKFSDRLLSSKMWFFFWVGERNRKYFSTIWTEMIPVAQFIQHFPIFWLGTLFCGHWAIPHTHTKKKQGKGRGLWTLGYSIKKIKTREGGWGHTFLNPRPTLKIFISLLYPWKFHKIVLDLLEIPRPKTKTPALEILHCFFLVTLRQKFHFIFS